MLFCYTILLHCGITNRNCWLEFAFTAQDILHLQPHPAQQIQITLKTKPALLQCKLSF